MKTKFTVFLLLTMAGLIPAGSSFAQIVIQHSGAANPLTEGFTSNSGGDVHLGPVFDDLGFDSWVIQSKTTAASAGYIAWLTLQELQAVTTHGWTLSANMRFVEISDITFVSMSFHMETARFRLRISVVDGEIVVSGDNIPAFSFGGNVLDYHEYAFAYDAISETAALWIDGIEWVTGISGFQTSLQPGLFGFGAGGEGITYSHWNDVTLAIIPEPVTVPLLAGLGALFCVGVFRWRRVRSGQP